MRFTLAFSFLLFITSISFALTNSYSDYFQKLGVAQSNVILQALQADDMDMVYGAIRRIGELGCTNAKKSVWGWLAQANPVANAGKVRQGNDLRDILKACIWTMGKIGSDSDAQELVNYFKDFKKEDHDMIREILFSLGEIKDSPAAVRALNRYTKELTDERDCEVLLTAILNQNSQSSANYLITMSMNVSFSAAYRKKLENAASQMALNGN